MKRLGHVLLAMILALLLIAGAVFGSRGHAYWGASPEPVVEGFIRQVVAGRYHRLN